MEDMGRNRGVKNWVLRRSLKKKGKRDCISTGFEELDRLIGGFKKRKVYLLGGGVGNGKTSLAQSFALNVASEGFRVAFCGVNRGTEEVVGSLRTMVDGKTDMLKCLDILINDLICPDIVKLLDCMVKYDSYLTADLLIIDELQLLSTKNSYLTRAEEYEAILREIKEVAGFLDIPIVIVSDLADEVETRENHRPEIADLKEFGRIDKVADTVILVYRDECYDKDSELSGIMELTVAKSDTYNTGVIQIAFIKQLQRCFSLAVRT